MTKRGALATTDEPQRVAALRRANLVRTERAEIKRRLAAGELSPVEVIDRMPAAARGMSLAALLGSQRYWGSTRSKRLLVRVGLQESKRLGELTERQRRLLLAALLDQSPST